MLALAVLALVAGEAQAAPTAEQSCQKALSLAAGTYLQCMEKAMGLYYGGADYGGKVQPAFGKCVDKYTANWPKLVKKYDGQGTSCTGDRYADNGDGTFADRLTGLVWEKKTDDSSVHDVDNTYSWSTGSLVKDDGTVFTTFLNTLNDGGFGGSNGWRLPSFYELNTLVAPGYPNCRATPCTSWCACTATPTRPSTASWGPARTARTSTSARWRPPAPSPSSCSPRPRPRRGARSRRRA